jgi:ribosome assembly protein SQT1
MLVQISTFEKPDRDTKIPPATQSDYTEYVLGLLPFSHIYGLVFVCHASVYQGDGVIVLPKFEFRSTLQAIQDYKISTLFLVCTPVGLYVRWIAC